MEIKYDQPIEVTRNQYLHLMTKFPGVVAGRVKDGKYHIKVWLTQYADNIKESLSKLTN